MAGTWDKIKAELGEVYRRTCDIITNATDVAKLKNKMAEQQEIIEKAHLEIGKIVAETRRGMEGEMPRELLLKTEEAERIGTLLMAVSAAETELETLETELAIVRARKGKEDAESEK